MVIRVMLNMANLPSFFLQFIISGREMQHNCRRWADNSHGGEDMAKKEKIVTDPFGSYTGLVRHPEEKPVQDADDL